MRGWYQYFQHMQRKPFYTKLLLCALHHHHFLQGDGGGALLLYEGESEPTIHGVAVFMHYLSCEMSLPLGFMRISSLRWWIYAVTGV